MPVMEIDNISHRLTKLEVLVMEKWTSHDKRSDERWKDLGSRLDKFTEELRQRPCLSHVETLTKMDGRLQAVETWQKISGWAVGVIYVALVGAIIKVLIH